MKRSVACLMFACGALHAGDGVIDLTRLANYAAQGKPAYITKDNGTGNPITDRGATLGRILFYDKRVSRNSTVSCSSCHVQAQAFGNLPIASTGVAGTTGRHSTRLINARFATETHFFWDERAATLEIQTTTPVKDHTEMGFSGTLGDPAFADLVTRLSAIDDYHVLFQMTYGSTAITEARIQTALSQFVRSIQSFDSRYDLDRAVVGNDGAPFPHFSALENQGKALFLNPPGAPGGGAGCQGCHRAPEFDIDPNSLNNGVVTKIGGGTDLTNTRSPSLRDLVGPNGASNGGMMHDASKTTLAAVIDHYNAVPNNTSLDNRLRGPGGNLNLNQGQKDALVAFLATLTGSAVYTDARWSDPFNASGNIDLIVMPQSDVKFTKNANNTATVSCRGVPGFPYVMQQSADLKNWTDASFITADANGTCSQLVGMGTKAYYRFVYVTP